MTQIVRSPEDLANAPVVVTIGTFDGVHIGHAKLLQKTADRAKELGVRPLIVTFEPLPAQVLRPDVFSGRLSSEEDKVRLLTRSGDADLLVLPFSLEFAGQTADEFLANLASNVEIREIQVGEEFALGHHREGTIEKLQHIGKQLGFSVHAMPRVLWNGEIVSSSRIRRLVQSGDVESAAPLLGRLFTVSGVVQEGARLGRTIGFPTANVAPPPDLVAVADGIYASFATIGGERLNAMTYIGTRPALNPGDRVIETHIFDFSDDIYGEQLQTEFVERLRPDADFPSLDALIAQMHVDEQKARNVLGKLASEAAIALN